MLNFQQYADCSEIGQYESASHPSAATLDGRPQLAAAVEVFVALMAHLEQQVQAEMDELIHLRGRLDTVLRPFVEIQLKLKEPCFCPRLSGAAFSRGGSSIRT